MKKPYEILPSGIGAPSSGGWTKGSKPSISGGTPVQGYGSPVSNGNPYMPKGAGGIQNSGYESLMKGSNPSAASTYGSTPLVGKQSKTYEIPPGAGTASQGLGAVSYTHLTLPTNREV